MAATTIIRPGAADGGTDKAENYLVKANDMLLTEFEEKRIMKGALREIPVAPGQVAVQVPRTGSIGGGYHTPGDNIIEDGSYLKDLLSGVITIASDKRLLAGPVMLDKLDTMLNYWSANGVAVREMGRFLAQVYDQTALWMVLNGAHQTANRTYTGEPAGQSVTITAASAAAVTGAQLVEAVFDMGDAFFNDNVPDEDRHIALPTDQYSKFIKESAAAGLVVDVDLQAGAANASVAGGYVKMVNGFNIHRTVNMPPSSTADNDQDGQALANLSNQAPAGAHNLDGTGTAAAPNRNFYDITSTQLVALAWQSGAVGVAKFQDPKFEEKYFIEYQADLGVASTVWGMEVLRPECCGKIVWSV